MASLPTVEIVGPGGTRVVNQQDVGRWEAKGYKVKGPKQNQGGEIKGTVLGNTGTITIEDAQKALDEANKKATAARTAANKTGASDQVKAHAAEMEDAAKKAQKALDEAKAAAKAD